MFIKPWTMKAHVEFLSDVRIKNVISPCHHGRVWFETVYPKTQWLLVVQYYKYPILSGFFRVACRIAKKIPPDIRGNPQWGPKNDEVQYTPWQLYLLIGGTAYPMLPPWKITKYPHEKSWNDPCDIPYFSMVDRQYPHVFPVLIAEFMAWYACFISLDASYILHIMLERPQGSQGSCQHHRPLRRRQPVWWMSRSFQKYWMACEGTKAIKRPRGWWASGVSDEMCILWVYMKMCMYEYIYICLYIIILRMYTEKVYINIIKIICVINICMQNQ